MKSCRYTQVGKIVNSYNALKQLSKHFIVVFALYFKKFLRAQMAYGTFLL
jgi:hypothetical protein